MVPKHVAIIMDGNGRWAAERALPRAEGHRAGARALRRIIEESRRRDIQALTVYAFSAQNWARPSIEVNHLMGLMREFAVTERPALKAQGIRVTTLGDLGRLPTAVRLSVSALVSATSEQREMTLCLALSYGGREDIVRAARHVATAIASRQLRPDDIDEQTFQSAMGSAQAGLPPLDLLIRTSGEHRLSNFLLWECAYAELYFTPVLWPDFGPDEFAAALESFASRDRRFGGTGRGARASFAS